MIRHCAIHIAGITLLLSAYALALYAEEPASTPSAVVGHYHGSAGLELPPREEPQLSETFRQGIASASLQLSRRMQEDLNVLAATPPLPWCAPKASARSFELPAAPTDYSDDLLFIRGELPEKTGEAFGGGLTIYRCSHDAGDTCAITAQEVGVRCAPSRVHVAKGRLLILEGVDALKNYEQEKRGRLHPEVAKRLKAFFGGAEGRL